MLVHSILGEQLGISENKAMRILISTFVTLLLASCAGITYTGVISGDSQSVSVRVNEFGNILTELDKTYVLADAHCLKYGKYSAQDDVVTELMKTAYFSCHTAEELLMMPGIIVGEILSRIEEENVFRGGSVEHPLTNLARRPVNVRNYEARYAEAFALARQKPMSISSPIESISSQDQCKAFGFTDDTSEMANCLLELYKIANQPQQNTVITNTAPARANSSDTTSGIELMNRGLQILNGVGTPSAPSSRTSTCTRIGDISGQVVTFNSIACPAGYTPTF